MKELATTQPRGKRELAARISAAIGLSSALEWLPKQPVLIVLNYHRIGDARQSPYDPGMFSATPEEFEVQVRYLKRRFHMTTLDEALAVASGRVPMRASVLITFDDGYLDNYTLAFPILRSHGVQGVFFLPTSFIGTMHLPLWDSIAYIIRNSRSEVIRLNYPRAAAFDLHRNGQARTIMEILRLYKHPDTQDQERFLQELKAATGAADPQNGERCFMNWQEAREMQRSGMAFGSHTHTHEILSKLSREREWDEVARSREILEHELCAPIKVFAYPVGLRHTFSEGTMHALRDAGYRAAFSFYGGLNRPGKIDPFCICRVGIGDQSHARFRLQTAVGALTGRWLF
jgi:peptidoglycan/xylan/chitin deacetylase (PgdA/CDA1 family)